MTRLLIPAFTEEGLLYPCSYRLLQKRGCFILMMSLERGESSSATQSLWLQGRNRNTLSTRATRWNIARSGTRGLVASRSTRLTLGDIQKWYLAVAPSNARSPSGVGYRKTSHVIVAVNSIDWIASRRRRTSWRINLACLTVAPLPESSAAQTVATAFAANIVATTRAKRGLAVIRVPLVTCPPSTLPLIETETLVAVTKGGQEMPRGKKSLPETSTPEIPKADDHEDRPEDGNARDY